MKVRFKFSDYLIFLILAINLYISTDLPAQFSLKSNIHYIQICLISVLLICVVRFQSVRFNPFKISLTGLTLIGITVFFVLSSFVFNIGNNSDLKSISKLITYPMIAYVFFTYLGKKLSENEPLFEKYLRVFIYFGIISSVISILIFILGLSPGSTYAFTTHGIFVHPNTTSFLYILVIPVAIYFYYSGKINSLTFTILLLLFTFVLLFTYSRAGYLGAFSAAIIFTFLRSKSKKVFILVSIIMILIASVFLLDFITAKQDSSFGRALLLIAAYNMIIQSSSSFLWGYGVYNGVEIFREEKIFFGNQEFVDDPHNFILLSGIQFGAIIPLLALIFIFFIYAKFYTSDKNKFSEKTLLKIYLSISITGGYLINNMLEDVIVYPEYYIMPVFLMFLGYVYYSLHSQKRNGNERSN